MLRYQIIDREGGLYDETDCETAAHIRTVRANQNDKLIYGPFILVDTLVDDNTN